MSLALQAALVFFAVAFADVCWTRWSSAVAAGRRWSAAWWGVGIYVIGSVSVIEYTANHWLLVPAVLGSFVGTAVAVKKP